MVVDGLFTVASTRVIFLTFGPRVVFVHDRELRLGLLAEVQVLDLARALRET